MSECELLPWDSGFFQLRIARLAAQAAERDSVAAALKWCEQESIDCLYALVPVDSASAVKNMEDHGFHLVDVRVTFEFDCVESNLPPVSLPVREFQPDDLNDLRSIARKSYGLSRFYYDGRFPREKCDQLYETWIANSCSGYADRVMVAEADDQAAAYITCHVKENRAGQIGLVGVADFAQGKGLAKALVSGALQWFVQQGCPRVEVVTQGRNIAAQKLYQKCGFTTKSVELWYHKWFR